MNPDDKKQQRGFRAKKAIVFGGGGARGAFEVGVWKALDEIGYTPDIVAGTSVGALNGALYLQGNYEKAEKLWKRIETGDILDYEFPLSMDSFSMYQTTTLRFFFHALINGGVSTEPLFSMIHDYIDDEEAIRGRGIEFGLTVTDYGSGDIIPCYLEDIPEGELPLYLMASASLYPAMEKTYIEGNAYVDGGYKNNIPIDLVLEKKADEILIVDIFESAPVKPVPELKQKNTKIIKTKWPLGDVLYFHEKRTETNISLGYLETMKAFDRYIGHWYTILPESLEKEHAIFYKYLKALLEGSVLPELTSMLTEEESQLYWLKTLKNAWRKRIRSKDLPLALAELAGRLFWISPAEAYGMDDLKAEIQKKMNFFEQEGYAQAMEKMIPEDFPLSGVEWMNHYREKIPFISDKRVASHFYRILEENPSECLSAPNQLLIQLRPLPFLLSLYLWYVTTEPLT